MKQYRPTEGWYARCLPMVVLRLAYSFLKELSLSVVTPDSSGERSAGKVGEEHRWAAKLVKMYTRARGLAQTTTGSRTVVALELVNKGWGSSRIDFVASRKTGRASVSLKFDKS